MKHPLRIWLAESKRTQRGFAEAVGCKEQHLANILNGWRNVGSELGAAIERETGNEVTYHQCRRWYAIYRKPRENEAA